MQEPYVNCKLGWSFPLVTTMLIIMSQNVITHNVICYDYCMFIMNLLWLMNLWYLIIRSGNGSVRGESIWVATGLYQDRVERHRAIDVWWTQFTEGMYIVIGVVVYFNWIVHDFDTIVFLIHVFGFLGDWFLFYGEAENCWLCYSVDSCCNAVTRQ